MKKRTSQNLENKSDITKLTQHEESKELLQTTLEQAEDKFKLLVDQAGDAFFILDFGGEIIDINQQASRSLGYSRLELLKMNILQVDTEITEKQHISQFWNTLDAGQYVTFEGVHRRKDGSTFPVEIRLGRLDLKNRKLLLALARDISKREKSELALMESESKLREAQEIAKIGIWEWDIVAHKGYYSEETYKIFDVDPHPDSKIVADKMVEVIHPEDRERHKEITIKLLDKNFSNDPYDYRVIHRDGTIRHVYTEAQVEYDADGNPIKMGGIVQDITERKRAEQALKKEAEFQNLISGISTNFIGLHGDKFEQAIQDSLSEIGKYFNSDTVRLIRLSPHGDVLKIRNTWLSEELTPPKEMPEIHKMIYPNLAFHYSKGESVVFSKFDDSPKWPEMRKILKFFGTKAGVGVPLESDKSGVDIFAMDKVLFEYTWPEDIIKQSKAIGKVLLSAMRRREVEVELQNGYVEIKRLKDQLQQENIYLKEEIKGIKNFDTIIGESKALKYVLFRVEQVAPTDTTVLISGETGTGKEVFTNALHQLSLRKNKSLVKVNCAALSSTLIESELFGHEKGAFTGANEKRIGRFELADGGTIFLDEISELSLELQAKLLRVLQEGEFERVGSSKTIKANVRIIAATNRNLEEEVKKNRFRVDLYYRLTTFIITIPPLRDRKEDIPLLVKFLVNKLGKKLNKSIKRVPQTVMRNLINYSWPGNVRELENVIENALIISNGEVLKAEIPGRVGLTTMGKSKLEDLERDHIIKILKLVNWQIGGKEGAAERLGLKRTTLNSKMKKLNIKKTSR